MRDPVARLVLWALCYLGATVLWFALGAIGTWVLHLGDPPIIADLAITVGLSLAFYLLAVRRLVGKRAII